MRGINESHYLSDDHSVFSASDIEASMNSHSQGNVYDVEHLATFELSEELALPADGMRRLLHMEKNGFGIWSQKMRIRLENRFIVILDFENGDEMERFPLHLIRDPTAFTNSNPGELYNNIFAFIVHPVEMHIFQCYNISAADLVEDVKMALSGRLPPNRLGSQNSLPPPPLNPPPEPPNFNNHHGDDNRDDTSSVGSEGRYEREVAILNRCFDDIERFIARLQYAAAAFRELQRRRKSKKSKKKDHGEGLLSLRARSPHEREFVDILQKFKLSFNLLAKLKSHIHDPNAPELVHFLFTPLALIVDASRDAHTVGLAPRVVSPLLSREAIELLNNCLTSKETELWHSLGDAWLLSREQWKGYVAPYQPVFMDGWSPVIPETNLGAAVASEAQRRVQEIRTAREHEAEQQRRVVENSRERSISPVEMMGDDFSAGQRAFLDSVRSHGGRVVVVSHPRTANNHKELTVVRGEYLEVLDDSKKWWKARNWKGQVAHVPHTIVSELPQESPSASSAYHNENGRTDNWSPPSSLSSDDDGFRSGRHGNLKNYIPPPTPRTPPLPPPPPRRDNINSRSGSPQSPTVPPKSPGKQRPLSEDLMQRELRNVLLLFRENKHINVHKTPEVYINQHSSAPEVKQWLKQKGFSERIIRQLAGMDGNELFALNRKQLEDFCGKEEGRRLDSQITISRSISGYKTARSSELKAILAKARAKVDVEDDDDDSSYQKSKPSKIPPADSRYRTSNVDYNLSPRSSESPDSTTKANTKINAGKSRPPISPQHYNNNNNNNNHGVTDSESEDDASMDGKSTLRRMLKQKQREIMNKNYY